MTRSEVQKMIRKSDDQTIVFSFLWNRRANKNGVRLMNIQGCKHQGSVKNAINALIEKGIVEYVKDENGKSVRGYYRVSSEVTK